jgi:hypothetical protein
MMPKFSFLLLLFSAPIIHLVQAQNHNREFEIGMPETKVPGSVYNKISFIDSRTDTTQMGIVQTGAFNRKAHVVAKRPLAQQLHTLMESLVDSAAGQGELLLQLRQCSFAEVTGSVSEKGYFFFRAMLYAKQATGWLPLASIDTALILTSSWDVTKGLFKNGSNIVSRFVSNHLLQAQPAAATISFADIIHIDSIEKAALKVYTSLSWQNGVYLSWHSFKNQLPDKPILQAEIKDGQLQNVKITGTDSKPEKVKAKKVYAVVYNDLPFIATDFGYYPLQKRENDLFFTGRAKVSASGADVIAASFFFGIIGGLIASDAAATFDMKIDHVSGGFIRLREIIIPVSE